MQHAGARIRNMDYDFCKRQGVHKFHCRFPSAFYAEGNDSAALAAQIFFALVSLVAVFKGGVVYPCYFIACFQESCHCQGVFKMAFHSQRQGLKSQIEQIRRQRLGSGAQIPHKLYPRLGYVGAAPEIAGIDYAVIAFVRGAELGIFACRIPVEIAAVNDYAAYYLGVTVHIFCGGVYHYIRAVLKGTAEYGSGKGIVYYKGHAVSVGKACVVFDVQHGKGGICYGLAENKAGIAVEKRLDLVLFHFGGDKAHFYSHSRHGNGKQVGGAAVYGGGADEILPRACYIEHGAKACRLTGGGTHGSHAAFKGCYFLFNALNGRVGYASIHMTRAGEIKKSAELFARVIFVGSALIYGKHPRLSAFWLPAALHANCFYSLLFLFHPDFSDLSRLSVIYIYTAYII